MNKIYLYTEDVLLSLRVLGDEYYAMYTEMLEELDALLPECLARLEGMTTEQFAEMLQERKRKKPSIEVELFEEVESLEN